MEITPAESLQNGCKTKYFTEEDIRLIVSKHGVADKECDIKKYDVTDASDKMLGFLCDYWKLKVQLGVGLQNKVLHYFIKAISVSNASKAETVKELNLFEKELYFYAVIKKNIEIPDLKPWSARFITELNNIMVFEDLNALKYKLRDKFNRFDTAHTLEALKTLARFHASSIIFEERKSKELGRNYSLNEDFSDQLGETVYVDTDPWFLQSMNAALDSIKLHSKYTEEEINRIEKHWHNVWAAGLALASPFTECKNVICHRDLWNNNLMFHYKKVGDSFEPDHCLLVDFQAARYQPPAGDVMLLMYCNLDPKFREENMEKFLNFYLDELDEILKENGIEEGFTDKVKFIEIAEKQRQWAVVILACLMQHFWIDDDLTTKIFSDTAQYDDIFVKNKSAFVLKMMQSESDYKEKIMPVFEEIVERYCL